MTVLILGVFAAVVIHIFRTIYVNNAFVTWDEVIYKFLSKIIFDPSPAASRFWPSLADIPDDFYLATYHACHYFRVNAYEAAKILNVLFFCFAAFPIFATISRVADRWTAVFVALLACASPFSAHTTYFMPEAMYFFVFWLAVYLLMRSAGGFSVWSPALAGATLGLLCLVKPHAVAVFLGANIVIAAAGFLLRNKHSERGKHRGILRNLLLLDGCFAASIGLVGYFLVVRMGGSFLGSTYSKIGGRILELSDLKSLILNLFYVGSGHLVYLLVLFAVPWVYLAVGLWREIRSDKPRFACVHLGLMAVFLFLVPFSLCVRFTAVTAPEIERLHGRYYNFVFPLFVAAFYVFYPVIHKGGHFGRTARISLAVLALAIPSAVLGFAIDRRPAVYDFPEVFWFTSRPLVLYAVLALSSAVLLYYSLSPRPRRRVLTALLAVLAVAGTALAFKEQYGNSIARIERRSFATAVDGLIGSEEKNSGMIFSSDIHAALYFQFYLSGIAEVRIVATPGTLKAKDLTAGTRWIVLLDNYTLEFPYEAAIQKPGFWFGRLVPGLPQVSGGAEKGKAVVAIEGEVRTVSREPESEGTWPADSDAWLGENIGLWAPKDLEFDHTNGGLLRITGPDPQLTLDLQRSPLEAESIAHIAIQFKAERPEGLKNSRKQIGCVYFRSCDGQFSQENSVTYSWDVKNKDWIEAIIPLSDHPNWNGDICALRLDPVHDVTTLSDGFRIRIGRVRLRRHVAGSG